VPGPNGSYVTVRQTNKFKKAAPAAAATKKGGAT